MYKHDRHMNGQTDRQTPHDDIGHACIASHGNDHDATTMVMMCVKCSLIVYFDEVVRKDTLSSV